MKAMDNEIEKLREAKHEHAGFLSRHEMEIELLRARGIR
jgi:hypothetical protein